MPKASNAPQNAPATDPNAAPDGGAPQDGGIENPGFPPIGEEHADEGGESGGQETLEERLARLEEQDRARQEAFAEERKQWQSTVDRLLQGQQASQQPQQQPAPQMPQGVDFSSLPDPVDKPQEYQQELSRRINYAMQQQAQALEHNLNQQHQEVQQTTQQAREIDAMWDKFQKSYPDLADKQLVLNGAVTAEFKEMQRRGVNPMQGMMQDADGFMQSVASRMRQELGTGGEGGGSESLPPANRTKGLGSGTKQGGAGQGGGRKPPGFIDQLKKAQMDSGLI